MIDLSTDTGLSELIRFERRVDHSVEKIHGYPLIGLILLYTVWFMSYRGDQSSRFVNGRWSAKVTERNLEILAVCILAHWVITWVLRIYLFQNRSGDGVHTRLICFNHKEHYGLAKGKYKPVMRLDLSASPRARMLPAKISRFSSVIFTDHILHVFGDKSDNVKTSDIFSSKGIGSSCYAASGSGEFSLSNGALEVEIGPVLTNLCQ